MMNQPALFDSFRTPEGATVYRHAAVTVPEHEHDDLDERFAAWLEVNQVVLDVFCEYALRLLNAGRKRIGAKRIVEEMRDDFRLQTTGDQFKMNNSFTSRLARTAVARHPKLDGVIEFRNLRS